MADTIDYRRLLRILQLGFFWLHRRIRAHRPCLTVLAEVVGFLRLWRFRVLRFTVHKDAVWSYGFGGLLITMDILGRNWWDLRLWRLLGQRKEKKRKALINDVLQLQQSLVYPCRRYSRAIGNASAMFVAAAGNVMFVASPKKAAMFVAAFPKLLGAGELLIPAPVDRRPGTRSGDPTGNSKIHFYLLLALKASPLGNP